jgi:hypothetical protein
MLSRRRQHTYNPSTWEAEAESHEFEALTQGDRMRKGRGREREDERVRAPYSHCIPVLKYHTPPHK